MCLEQLGMFWMAFAANHCEKIDFSLPETIQNPFNARVPR